MGAEYLYLLIFLIPILFLGGIYYLYKTDSITTKTKWIIVAAVIAYFMFSGGNESGFSRDLEANSSDPFGDMYIDDNGLDDGLDDDTIYNLEKASA